MGLRGAVHQFITRVRYRVAQRAAADTSTVPIMKFAALDENDVFYIVGAGGSVNDLSPADIQLIESGTSAAINMAAILPMRFKIYSMEYIASESQFNAISLSLSRRKGDYLIWFQRRSKYSNEWSSALQDSYPFFSYPRCSVSTGREIEIYRRIFRSFMVPRVFHSPDLRVSFALTGSVARLVLLGCSLGYRRFCFAGVDLGNTPYFWQEATWSDNPDNWVDLESFWKTDLTVANFMSGEAPVPNVSDFLRILKDDSPKPLDFFTLDPKRRSLLTEIFDGWRSG